MKKIISLAIMSLFIMTMTAQKRNFQGDKMVDKLIVTEYIYGSSSASQTVRGLIHTTIEFSYNGRSHLTGIDAKTQEECLVLEKKRTTTPNTYRYRLNNKGILNFTFKEEGKESPFSKWKYYFDGDIINRIEMYDYSMDSNGQCIRHDSYVTYQSNERGFPTLATSTNEWYVKLEGTNHFVKGDGTDSRVVEYYRYRNGDLDREWFAEPTKKSFDTNGWSNNFVYSDIVNDTNINWSAFVVNYMQEGNYASYADRLLTMTEWIPCKSMHQLIEYHTGRIFKFNYLYNKGNLTKVEITRNGISWLMIEISYVK